jgi:hypothetical protein
MLVYCYGDSSRVWSNSIWNGRIWFGDWSRKLVNKCGIVREKISKWNRITKFIRSSIIEIDSSISGTATSNKEGMGWSKYIEKSMPGDRVTFVGGIPEIPVSESDKILSVIISIPSDGMLGQLV